MMDREHAAKFLCTRSYFAYISKANVLAFIYACSLKYVCSYMMILLYHTNCLIVIRLVKHTGYCMYIIYIVCIRCVLAKTTLILILQNLLIKWNSIKNFKICTYNHT